MSTEVNCYGARSLVGGVTGALDAIDGTDLEDKDICLVAVQDDKVYFFTLDEDSGLAESVPDIIAPDANGGIKRWILEGSDVPVGVNTGDLIRWNATTGHWEVKAEPLVFSSLILTPQGAPPSPVEGALYFDDGDKNLYYYTV